MPELSSQVAQLSLLQSRVALHGSRLWQLPTAYLGIVGGAAVIFAGQGAQSDSMPLKVLAIISGMALLACMEGARRSYLRTAEYLRELETQLELVPTTLYCRHDVWPYFGWMATMLAAVAVSILL